MIGILIREDARSKSVFALVTASILMVLLLAAQISQADERDNAGEDLNASKDTTIRQTGSDVQLKTIGPHRYRLGSLTIDAEKRIITCPGEVNMNRGGPIELLACTATGKRHESVFVLDTRPFHFQIALLLLNVTPGYNEAADKNVDPSVSKAPVADTVSIDVRWRIEKESGTGEDWMRRSANEFLHNVKTGEVMHEVEWAFIGSRWVNNTFKADQTGSIIVTYRDPFGVLELASKEVNSDTWFEAKKENIPPVGTEVELIVQAKEQKQEKKEKRRDTK